MLRIYRLTVISAFVLIIVAFIPGCYTIVGYPPPVEESIVDLGSPSARNLEEEAARGHVYRDYEYYYDRPYSYYRDYYDPYYSFSYPYHQYYWDSPWWYYDDYYHWDYDDYYVPEKKPEIRKRGASGLRPVPGPERGSRSRLELEEDEEKKQPVREIRNRQRTKNRTQRSVERKHRDDTSSSKKRSAERESQDEE